MSPEKPRPAAPSAPTKPAAGGSEVFDVEKIRQLVELMKGHDLTQIDLRQGEMRIQLHRGGAGEVVTRVVPAAAPAAAPAEPPAPAPKAPAADDPNIALVRSPMVGTFYSAPDPNSTAYVKVGDHVGPDTTVCIVEAMKVFNEIPAEVSGKVIAVLVENGEPVDVGRPLFKVDTRG